MSSKNRAEPGRQWMSLYDVAEAVGVSYRTVMTWVTRDVRPLPASQPGGFRGQYRVVREDLDAWMDSHCARVTIAERERVGAAFRRSVERVRSAAPRRRRVG